MAIPNVVRVNAINFNIREKTIKLYISTMKCSSKHKQKATNAAVSLVDCGTYGKRIYIESTRKKKYKLFKDNNIRKENKERNPN